MDLEKMGTFIMEKRKQKGLTQKELADILHLSNRTISKWECGKGIPDSSIMIELCEILDISVNELLSGEELSGDVYKAKADENVMALIEESGTRRKGDFVSLLESILTELVIFFFVVFCGYLNIMNSAVVIDYVDVPAALMVLGASGIILKATGFYRDFFYALKISVWGKEVDSKGMVNRAACAVIIVILAAFLAGGTLSVVSMVNTLVTTTPVNEGGMYAALAVGKLGLLYALIVCLLLLPVLGRIFRIKLSTNFT